jgi:predicted transposase/invertase (TIGR01784 family)
MTAPSNPHDALFKYVFSQPEHAAAELQAVLPAALVTRVDWKTLTLLPSSFVDEQLSGREADLLFSVKCDGREARVFILFEHQSTSDPLMAFRLLRYLVKIWDAYLAEHPKARRLPAIIPVVLHHGRQGWRAPRNFSALLDVEGEMRRQLSEYLPQFEYVLNDLTVTDDATLRARTLELVGVTLLLMKRARHANLLEKLAEWRKELLAVTQSSNGAGAIAAILMYAQQVGDIAPEDLQKFARDLGPIAEEGYMTGAQILRAEGRVEGRAQGKAQILLRQLTLRFGSLPEATQQKLWQASAEQLDVWAERVITGASVEEILS